MAIEKLKQIQNLWNLSSEPVFHRFVANDIYFSTALDLEVVIRITPSSQRSVSEIRAELKWISYLKTNSIQYEQNTFHVVVFKKILGERITKELLKPQHIQLWAEQMAKMHNLAEGY